MTDSIFLLRCVDCDAHGLLSRLWLRASVEVGKRRSGEQHQEVHRYVECMNCGAHLKSRYHDRMESVGDEEWRRCVGEDAHATQGSAPSAS